MATNQVAPAPDLESLLKGLQAQLSLTTDVGAVANCITEVAKVLQTPEGQLTMKAWRENSNQFNSSIVAAWNKFTGIFK